MWDPEDSTIRFYVNADCGHDWYNGKSLIPDGSDGPLATIQAAIDKVGDGYEENQDIPTMGYIIIAQGSYVENIRIDGKNIILTSLNPDDPQFFNNRCKLLKNNELDTSL